jgi:hypothetical protein
VKAPGQSVQPRSDARRGSSFIARLLRCHRAQALEKLRFVDRLLEDGSGFTGTECGVTGYHDDPDTSIVQLIDQRTGAFAAAETEIDERNVRSLLADQMLGRSRRRDGASHIRPASLEQALHGAADMPAIFDHEDTHPIQIRGCGHQRVRSAG